MISLNFDPLENHNDVCMYYYVQKSTKTHSGRICEKNSITRYSVTRDNQVTLSLNIVAAAASQSQDSSLRVTAISLQAAIESNCQ